jgi:hypothetical protein
MDEDKLKTFFIHIVIPEVSIHPLAGCLLPDPRRSVPHQPRPRVCVATRDLFSLPRVCVCFFQCGLGPSLAESTTSRGMRPVLVPCESLDCFGRKIEAMADGFRRQGDRYILTKEEISRFHSDGYVHLKVHPKILSTLCGLVRSARKRFWDVCRNSALHVLKSSLKSRLRSRGSVGCPCIL